MKLYVVLSLLTAVMTQEMPVKIIDSAGVEFINSPWPKPITEGDYIDCVPDTESPGVQPLLFYAWKKITNSFNEVADGPSLLTLPLVGQASRLHMTQILGYGQPTAYRCIAAVGEIDDLLSTNFTGADINFRVDSTPSAGNAFYGRDYVQVTGGTIDLACRRQFDTGRVVWETIDLETGEPTTLYDTDDEDAQLPSQGYKFVNETDINDYSLRITMLENDSTAVAHRCTVRDTENERKLTPVTSTGLLFRAEFTQQSGCASQPEDLSNLVLGTSVTFSGCDVTVHTGDDSITEEDYTIMTLWTMLPDDPEESVTDIETTRVLDGASTYTTVVASDTAGVQYGCAVQVHREEVSVVSARVDSICNNSLSFSINTNEVNFRVYYGNRDNLQDDEYINFGTWNRYKAILEDGGDITCEVDAIPTPGNDTVKMQTLLPGEEEWEDDDDNVIEGSELASGAIYRCVYIHEGEEKISGAVHVVKGIIDTIIRGSNGETLNQNDVHQLNAGDYIDCMPDDNESASLYYPPQYMWMLSEVDSDTKNYFGPRIVRQQNIQDMVNRLYIDHELGRDNPIAYRCVGTDYIDVPSIPIIGRLVKFLVVQNPAGEVFEAGDYVRKVEDPLQLKCVRLYPDARVLWERVNANGNTTVIYDTDGEEEDPIDGYQFVAGNPGEEGNFSLSITINNETAAQTRCTVSAPQRSRQYTTVSQTAMIYGVADVLECTSSPDIADVGKTVRFSGCGATIVVSSNALSADEDLQVVVHWTRTNEEDPEIIEASRVLNIESVYDEVALSQYDGDTYQCGIQISRPQAITNSAVITDICQNPLTMEVNEGTLRFRTYYGDEEDPGDILDLRYMVTELAKEDTSNLLCEVDRHPQADDTVTWHKRSNPQDDWQPLNSHTVDAQDIALDDEFKCVNSGINDTETHIIRIVSGTNDLEAVEIVNSAGVVLDEDTPNLFFEGEYIECRPADQSVTIPVYVWVKSIQIQNLNGPNLIKQPNVVNTNVNRLPMSYFLGEGENIAYRCIAGEDFAVGFTELMGRKVVFSVRDIDESQAGTVPLDTDYAARNGETVILPCVRHNADFILDWWKVTTAGEELLYTTSTPNNDPPEGYEIIDQGGLRYDLSVTVQPETATQIRCVVTDPAEEEPKSMVNGTTMVFAVDTDATTCTADGLGDPSNDLGDVVHFSGCTASIMTAEDSGIGPDLYDTIAYWSKGDNDNFDSLDDTRVLTVEGKASEYHMEVSSDHGATYRCMVEIKRPLEAQAGSTINEVCEDFTVTVTDNDIWYRMYYGPDNSPENQVQFVDDADEEEEQEKWFSDGSKVICEAEQHPTGPLPAFVEWKQGNFGNWEETEESEVVGQVDAYYRCFYDTNEPRSATIILSQSADSVPPLGIYYNGELVEEGATLDTLEDEYLECKPLDSVSADLRYIWQKNSDATIEGPIYVNNDNEADGSNRLLLNMNLGAGTTTSYRCTATPAANNATIPEPDGPVANFNVNNVTGSDGQRLEVGLLTLMTVITAYLLNKQ